MKCQLVCLHLATIFGLSDAEQGWDSVSPWALLTPGTWGIGATSPSGWYGDSAPHRASVRPREGIRTQDSFTCTVWSGSLILCRGLRLSCFLAPLAAGVDCLLNKSDLCQAGVEVQLSAPPCRCSWVGGVLATEENEQ